MISSLDRSGSCRSSPSPRTSPSPWVTWSIKVKPQILQNSSCPKNIVYFQHVFFYKICDLPDLLRKLGNLISLSRYANMEDVNSLLFHLTMERENGRAGVGKGRDKLNKMNAASD